MTTTPAANPDTYLGALPGLERLYDNIQSTLPGVMLDAVRMSVWNAIESFCTRSTYFRQEADWRMGPGQTEYDFNPVDESLIAFTVLRVSGMSRWYVKPPATLVDPYPSPTQGRDGKALLALRPVALDANLPDELFSLWFETILSGALFRLYSQPLKPYSSAQHAAAHGSLYSRGIAVARARATMGFSGQDRPWRYPYFATGRR